MLRERKSPAEKPRGTVAMWKMRRGEGKAGEGEAWEGEASKGDERRGMMMMETRHGGRKLVGI